MNSNPLWYVGIATFLAAIPLFVGLCTCYIKVSVVLGVLKNAFGAQQVPSGLVILTLSLGITCFTMAPVIEKSVSELGSVDLASILKTPTLARMEELGTIMKPWRAFMEAHSGEREVRALQELARETSYGAEPNASNLPTEQVPLRVLIPSFILTELKEGFTMAFILLLPFLVIDLIVANLLMGMGMMMVSPVLISLPLKLILFVMADGWILLSRSLINSYSGVG